MKFIKQLDRFQKLDYLIKNESTGNPTELSNNLGISRSHLYRLLETLKDYGASIEYSRKLNSFYYNNSFNIENIFSCKILSFSKMEKIKGGFSSKKNTPSYFMRRSKYNLASINIFMGEVGYQY